MVNYWPYSEERKIKDYFKILDVGDRKKVTPPTEKRPLKWSDLKGSHTLLCQFQRQVTYTCQ